MWVLPYDSWYFQTQEDNSPQQAKFRLAGVPQNYMLARRVAFRTHLHRVPDAGFGFMRKVGSSQLVGIRVAGFSGGELNRSVQNRARLCQVSLPYLENQRGSLLGYSCSPIHFQAGA